MALAASIGEPPPSDDGVRLEAAHQIRAFIDGLDAWIGFDIGKQLDGHFVFALMAAGG